jgi:hypothetical protein
MGCVRIWYLRQDASLTIALFTLCVLSDRNILRDQIISSIAAPIIVHRNSACASLNPLDVVRLSLIVRVLNHGISDSLLTVSMSIIDLV